MSSENGSPILSSKETGFSPRELVVCSGGRGTDIIKKIGLYVPTPYSQIRLINPQTRIPPDQIAQFTHIKQCPSLMRIQLQKLLQITTEGRPMTTEDDYVYGINEIPEFQRDITRIALLKFRALFPLLFQTYQQGHEYLEIDAIARDTGQVIKVPERDLYIYQSHPGKDERKQWNQFLHLFYSDYALIGTAFVVLSGRIPTRTLQGILEFYNLIYSQAHGLQIQKEQLPDGMDIKIHTPFFITVLRITEEIDHPNEVLTTL
jgi:hypothetical protein